MNEKQCNVCLTVKPLEQFHKSAKGLLGRRADCGSCFQAKQAVTRALNRDELRRRDRERYAQNAALRERQRAREKEKAALIAEQRKLRRAADPERARAYEKNWTANNKERCRAAQARYRETHHEQVRARQRERDRAAPEKIAARAAARRAAKLQATPAWANQEAIKGVYLAARVASSTCSAPWHVDHIVPLRHELVCGLHCEANLQILPGRLNLQKSNRFWPDMPE